jgi:hypothetical protein
MPHGLTVQSPANAAGNGARLPEVLSFKVLNNNSLPYFNSANTRRLLEAVVQDRLRSYLGVSRFRFSAVEPSLGLCFALNGWLYFHCTLN